MLQPQFTYGNAVRNSIIGPGIFNFDMSILRNFRFGGSKSLQFRLEAFNTFNQPVWNDPNTSVNKLRNYGTITQHAQADARAAARREVRVLTPAREAAAEMPPPTCAALPSPRVLVARRSVEHSVRAQDR